ncbi:MAG: bifunctional phosphopantothenoylcysteine decarboxylase/phosphopantothenate--cysteine ligase CoaBC, partial [Janthinobacterium lividum]
SEMGHISLSRSADLVVVCPASADILARMAAGLASDLATTLLLATDTPVLVAPAMNVRMWEHPATRANMDTLRARGLHLVGPEQGVMACNEFGAGRLAEPSAILDAVAALFSDASLPQDLQGRHALVTAGPTHEPIDPVRYLSNRSSGRQGYAIAAALAARGARVTLVSGPTVLAAPPGVARVEVETAQEMLAACEAAGSADIAVLTAAVADWRVATPGTSKLKKQPGQAALSLSLVLNPDILALLSAPGPGRAALVIGFAAETDALLEHAGAKRLAKNCDWIVANDVGTEGVMGGTHNQVHLLTGTGTEAWPRLDKREVAARLAARIAAHLAVDAA